MDVFLRGKLMSLAIVLMMIAAFAQGGDQQPLWGPVCRGNASDSAECITPPRVLYSPEPEYDDASRKAKIEGTVVLRIIVTRDGLVKDPKINRGLCEALDKKAVETVSQWKFTPAMKNGKAVSLYLMVEVTFKLDQSAPAL
jgi:TonB family protein